MKTLTFFVLSIFLFTSCATILGGSKNGTHIKGMPEGAEVYYNGEYRGTAPMKVSIPKQAKQGNSTITVKAPGYEDQNIQLHRKISIGWLVVDVLTGAIPLVVDFLTGAIYKPRPNKVNYKLQKKE